MKRAIYKPLGLVLLGVGMAGILLPVLPSTPFVLLAAWCFARSSERWHRRLLESELFGPIIRNWEENRCVSRRTKRVALASMALAGTASIVFAIDDPWLKIATGCLLLLGAGTLLSLKTCAECEDARTDEST